MLILKLLWIYRTLRNIIYPLKVVDNHHPHKSKSPVWSGICSMRKRKSDTVLKEVVQLLFWCTYSYYYIPFCRILWNHNEKNHIFTEHKGCNIWKIWCWGQNAFWEITSDRFANQPKPSVMSLFHDPSPGSVLSVFQSPEKQQKNLLTDGDEKYQCWS